MLFWPSNSEILIRHPSTTTALTTAFGSLKLRDKVRAENADARSTKAMMALHEFSKENERGEERPGRILRTLQPLETEYGRRKEQWKLRNH